MDNRLRQHGVAAIVGIVSGLFINGYVAVEDHTILKKSVTNKYHPKNKTKHSHVVSSFHFEPAGKAN